MREKQSMNKYHFVAIAAIMSLFFLCSCGGSDLPLDKIRASLKGVPAYSIVLDDMKEEGNLFKTHYHKYRIITEDKATETDWLEVPENYFKQNASFLGMTIWVKKDGKESKDIGPPGYEYVGNTQGCSILHKTFIIVEISYVHTISEKFLSNIQYFVCSHYIQCKTS